MARSRFTHHRSNPFSGGSTIYTIARLAAEVLVFLLWVASAALMLRPRAGCDAKRSPPDGPLKGKQFCLRRGDDDYAVPYDDQPIVTWTVAIVVSLIEAYVPTYPAHFLKLAVSTDYYLCSVSFIATVVMVWLDDRRSKVGGGTSYA